MHRSEKEAPDSSELTETIEAAQNADDTPHGIVEICTKALIPVVKSEPCLKRNRLMAMSMLEAFERDEDYELESDFRVLN